MAARLVLGGCLFILGLSVALACGSHMNKGGTGRITTTVTTNESVTFGTTYGPTASVTFGTTFGSTGP
jgi:hypothetical protein